MQKRTVTTLLLLLALFAVLPLLTTPPLFALLALLTLLALLAHLQANIRSGKTQNWNRNKSGFQYALGNARVCLLLRLLAGLLASPTSTVSSSFFLAV